MDVKNNSHIWGEEYSRKLADILPMQRLDKRSTTNPEAYRLYLKGR